MESLKQRAPSGRCARFFAKVGACQGLLHSAAAAIVVAAVYVPTLWGYFLRDDWGHLTHTWRFEENSLGEIWWAPHTWFYRPVFLSVLGFMSYAFGPHAMLWHLVAVALHVGNALLVRGLLRRMGAGPLAATVGALAFGLYPRSPEAVAWLSAMSGVLAAFFGLLAAHIALSTRVSPLPRALLCGLCWALALLSKEEAVGLMLVLPLAPILLGRLETRAQLAQWVAGCLILAVVLLGFLLMESRGEVAYGSVVPKPSLSLLRKLAYVPLWVMGDPLSWELMQPVWSLALLAAAALAIWRRYPALRLGLLWLFATAMPIALALGVGAIQPRLAYVPSIGLALCLAALVERVASRREPLGILTWTTLTMFLLVCLSMGGRALWIAGAVVSALCLWFAPAPPRPRHSAIVYLAAAGLVCRALEPMAPYFHAALVLPPGLTLAMPFVAIGALYLATRGRAFGGPHGESLGEALVCSCAIFWANVPALAALLLLLLVLIARVVRADPGYAAERLGALRRIERLAQRHGAPALAALVALAWLGASYHTNLGWMRTGRRASATVAQVAPILAGLPQRATVEILPSRPGAAAPGTDVHLDAAASLIAGRPDLQVLTRRSRKAAADRADAVPPPAAQYHILWTSDGQARPQRAP